MATSGSGVGHGIIVSVGVGESNGAMATVDAGVGDGTRVGAGISVTAKASWTLASIIPSMSCVGVSVGMGTAARVAWTRASTIASMFGVGVELAVYHRYTPPAQPALPPRRE